jgi:hypothetical protein
LAACCCASRAAASAAACLRRAAVLARRILRACRAATSLRMAAVTWSTAMPGPVLFTGVA